MSASSISRDVSVSFEPTPAEMARVFWEWDSDAQALFFARIGEVSDGQILMQLHAIVNSAEKSLERGDSNLALYVLEKLAYEVFNRKGTDEERG